jgi:hypothetical protein
MARIRSVKPELRISLTATQWPREIRYFWVLLWGYLDDHGYGIDEPRLIKPDCFPLDDDLTPDDIDKWLDIIAGAGSICRFTVNGRRYLHAPKWADHQRPQHPAVPKYPVCTLSHDDLMTSSGESHETNVGVNGVQRKAAGQTTSGESHETLHIPQEGLTPEGVVEGVVERGGVAVAREARSRSTVTLLANSLLDEHRRSVKPSPPRDVIRQIGERIDSLLDDPEISPDEVREALRRLRANRKWGPGMLPNLVNEIRQENAGQGTPRSRNSRQQETDELFEQAAMRIAAREDSA